MGVKSAVKTLLPAPALKLWADYRLRRDLTDAVGRDAEEIFTRIYESNGWGGRKGEYYSGTGSDAAIAANYIDWVRAFMRQTGVRRILDLGCGDFRVGQQMLMPGAVYIGADIVKPLIDRNNAQFGSQTVRFVHLDATKDALPDADLCLIRQVLQHLSNAQVSDLLDRAKRFKYVLITEHHPAKLSEANIDKPTGSGIRAYKGSGIYPEKPPFSRDCRIVIETIVPRPLISKGEKIVTYLLTQYRAAS